MNQRIVVIWETGFKKECRYRKFILAFLCARLHPITMRNCNEYFPESVSTPKIL